MLLITFDSRQCPHVVLASQDTSKPGKPKGDFPVQLLPKTDEERVQNIPGLLQRVKGVSGWLAWHRVSGASHENGRQTLEGSALVSQP